MSGRSLPDDQHMARVRLEEERWREFRALAVVKGRSVTDYLGWLVQKELNRAQRTEARRTTRGQARPAEEPVDQSWVPPWEQ
jgi:hypothetical protein